MEPFNPKTKWRSQTKYIDIDHGHEIDKQLIIKNQYRIIYIKKNRTK